MEKLLEAIIRVGGAAGTGVASVGQTIATLALRSGLHIQTYNYYQSIIRGGHVAYHIRVSDEEIGSQGDGVDYVLALDEYAVEIQSQYLTSGGYLIYDKDTINVDKSKLSPEINLMPIPLISLARKEGRETRMLNTSGFGVIAALLCLGKDIVEEVLQEQFGAKSKRLAESNVNAALASYDYVQEQYPECQKEFKLSEKRRLLMNGNEAIALGAITAGCRFYAAYPMTPATGILHVMAANAKKYGIVAKQAEDEIAVINMTIGAGFAGARAMCGTSGGGFALFSEAIGEAGITETPLVIVESARGGPSTGLPTRTEQGDLNQILGASQGDYPKIIIAPGNVEEAFYTAVEAFNLADKYQCPVIISIDLQLSESASSVNSLDADVPIIRPIKAAIQNGEEFKRYLVTDSGISPLVHPGDPESIFVAGSDEHDEDDSLLSDVRAGLPDMLVIRRKQMEKRMRKIETALNELPAPTLEGPEDAPLTIIGYGSTKGAITDARKLLEKYNISTNHLHIKYLQPFHSNEVYSILERSKKCLVVEGNYTGQLERLVKGETGSSKVFVNLRRYDGDPFYPLDIVKKVKEVL